MKTRTPAGLDKRQIRRAFGRAAATYDQVAVVQRRMADELLDRLDIVKLSPQRVLDAGCGTGYVCRALAKRYPGARIVGLDLAREMVVQARRRAPRWRSRARYVCGDMESIPFADSSFDLVVSNAALQWCHMDRVFQQVMRVLRGDGLFIFTTFGPDTLQELRAAWREVDSRAEHVHAFVDMHDVGDALVNHGFETPVMDMDRLVVTYRNLRDAFNDLKELGSSNAVPGRPRGLLGKSRFRALTASLESRRNADGLLQCSYEMLFGHAWAPALRNRRAPDGSVAVPLAHIPRSGR